MINTVTIPVTEYDNLRKQREEVIRLKEIKEPAITIILKEIPVNIKHNPLSISCDITREISIAHDIKKEELDSKLQEFKNDVQAIIGDVEETRALLRQNSKALIRANEQLKRQDAYIEQLDRIPNWIKRLFI